MVVYTPVIQACIASFLLGIGVLIINHDGLGLGQVWDSMWMGEGKKNYFIQLGVLYPGLVTGYIK